MKSFKFQVPKKKTYGSLRVWSQTRDKFKMLALKLDMSVVELMEHIAVQVMAQFTDQDDGDEDAQQNVKGQADTKNDRKT